MTVINPPKSYTEEEYLAMEVTSEIRSEYRNGDIIAMPGDTPTHNEVTATLMFLLMSSLRKKPYSIFITDQRLWIPERAMYTYPDIMVTARPTPLKAGRKDTIIDPILIAEVLSESTQGYDRGDKFAAYRTIPTLQDYLLIDPNTPHIEYYAKQGEQQWLFTEYSSLEQSFILASVNVQIPLMELYETVEFEQPN
ncbi:MAG: Uma2 family endonuclease [Gloeomargaritaceae cyanobacterium C42_A2020_066]|nr:Uma2 family endonuclease [Gloeomargaritaceae cyanobacterium C42_A2020_066]